MKHGGILLIETMKFYIPATVVVEVDWNIVKAIESKNFSDFDRKMSLILEDCMKKEYSSELDVLMGIKYQEFEYEYYPVNRPEEII